jgi:hypothetical protein
VLEPNSQFIAANTEVFHSFTIPSKCHSHPTFTYYLPTVHLNVIHLLLGHASGHFQHGTCLNHALYQHYPEPLAHFSFPTYFISDTWFAFFPQGRPCFTKHKHFHFSRKFRTQYVQHIYFGRALKCAYTKTYVSFLITYLMFKERDHRQT